MRKLCLAGSLTGAALVLFVLVTTKVAAQSDRTAPATQPAAASTTRPAVPDPARFADDIKRFVEWDRRNSFPENAILFVGSSSIRGWATRERFPDWPVLNRGFGGSHVRDVNHYFDQVVAPYRPRGIVFYAGDNDIASGAPPEAVRDGFAEFVARVRKTQPDVPIVFLSIKGSASRWEHWPRMQAANVLVRELCEQTAGLQYVDVATPLLGPDGQPRAELFLADRLHLSEAGYQAWTEVLRPVLARWMPRD